MSPLINPIFAVLDKAPEIYGPLPPPQEQTLTEQAWFFPTTGALGLLLLLLIVWGLVRLIRHRPTRRSPDRELRMRLAALQGQTPSQSFYLELAAILRAGIGIAFEEDTAKMTARELAALIERKDHFGRSKAALDLIRRCEQAAYSGLAAEGGDTLCTEGRTALGPLLIHENGGKAQ